MKKLVASLVVFALITGVVFAADGININAWGRGYFSPLTVEGGAPKTVNGDDVYMVTKDSKGNPIKPKAFTGKGATWNGQRVRVDFRIVGDSEFIGFGLNATAEDNALNGNDDAAYIYAKPFGGDILKIKIGMLVEEELRGKFGTANNTFDNFVLPTKMTGEPEDRIFQRFATGAAGHLNSTYLNTAGGVLLTSRPIDGLFLGFLFNGNGTLGGGTFTSNAFHYVHVGAGYVLQGIGHARVQYIGGSAGTYNAKKVENAGYNGVSISASEAARIEAAFALTAIDGLLVDVGGKFYLPVNFTHDSTAKGGAQNYDGVKVGLGASFRRDALAVTFRLDTAAFGSYAGRLSKKVPVPKWDSDTQKASTTEFTKIYDKSTGGSSIDYRLNVSYDLEAFTPGFLFALNHNTPGTDAWGKPQVATPIPLKSTASAKAKYDRTLAEEGGSYYDPELQLGFGAFAQKGLGKGVIKAGLTYTTETLVHTITAVQGSGKQADGTIDPTKRKYEAGIRAMGSNRFSIPIIIEYAFF